MAAAYYRDMFEQPATPLVCEWEPVLIGPTWQIAEDGRWMLPRLSLGLEALIWCGVWLEHEPGAPWRFTAEQARFLMWWFALDESGRFIYRDGVLQRLKGWGKDPLGACVCAFEAFGPCRFSHWDEDGFPIAKDVPGAWVQTAATAMAQTRNTMQLFDAGLFSEEARKKFRIMVQVEQVRGAGGRIIESVTSSPGVLQGNRGTFVLLNETHEWHSANKGHRMSQVLKLNATKSPDGAARTLRITNAFEPGAGSVAEIDRQAYDDVQAGTGTDVGVLYDSLEAGPTTPLTEEAVRAVIPIIRGDSHWLQVERIVQGVLDGAMPPSQSRRFWYNQITAAEDAWLSPQEWDSCANPEHTVPERAIVTLGFDGSKSNDHTALVGCEVATGHLFTIEVWDPSKEEAKEIDRTKVDEAVAGAFAKYDVVGFYCDRSPWESYIDKWAEQYGEQLCVRATAKQPVEWDMSLPQRHERVAHAMQSFHAAVIDNDLKHEGSDRARYYVLNARAFFGSYGVYFNKDNEMSPRKIDWLDAAVLARQARMDYIALPDAKKRQVAIPLQVFF